MKASAGAAPHAATAALDDGTGSIIMPAVVASALPAPGVLPAAPDTSPPAPPG